MRLRLKVDSRQLTLCNGSSLPCNVQVLPHTSLCFQQECRLERAWPWPAALSTQCSLPRGTGSAASNSLLADIPTAAQVQYNFTVILNPGAGTDKQYSFLYSCLQGRGFPLDYVAWADYHSSLPIDQLLAVHGHSSGAAEPPVCSGACSVMIAAASALCTSSTLPATMA